jgi:tetratricopeptide (TPR) repeat protein
LLNGEPERALADLNRAIALNRKLDEAWVNRGAVWFLKGDFTQSIADFDEALKLNPRLRDTYCNRGAALLAQDKLAEAEADFARCRALGGAPNPNAEKLLLEMEGRKR